jgi:hypothetical protein
MDDNCDFDKEVKRSLVLSDIAKTAITNAALMSKCLNDFYDIPIPDNIPLIPQSKSNVISMDGKRKSLITNPKDDETYGYKRHSR